MRLLILVCINHALRDKTSTFDQHVCTNSFHVLIKFHCLAMYYYWKTLILQVYSINLSPIAVFAAFLQLIRR